MKHNIECNNNFRVQVCDGMILISRDGFVFNLIRTDDAVQKVSEKWATAAGVKSYTTKGEFTKIKES